MQRIAPWAKAVNVVLTPTIANRRKKVDKLIDRAVRESETKLATTAHGNERFIDDMRLLLRCYADTDGLTPIGWRGAAYDIGKRIENRLRVRKLHALHPEIADEPVRRPVVITGLPRTGTAFTQRLLAAPNTHRAPLLWELMNTDLHTAPDVEDGEYHRQAVRAAEGLNKLSPMMPVVYRLGADEPEACVFVLPHGITNLVRAPLPGYLQWMLERDATDDYRYLKQVLQVLQHGRPRRRWVLRSAAHLWNLDCLYRAFPDAQLVWTHREPADALASLCSMVEAASAAAVSEPDPRQIGRQWLGLLATGLDRGRTVRRRLPDRAVIDLPYSHLTERVHDRLPNLYEKLDLPWGAAERAMLETELAEPRKPHQYDLARYGVTPAEVDQVFAGYRRQIARLEKTA